MICRILHFLPSKEIHVLLLPKNRPDFLNSLIIRFWYNQTSDLALRIIMLTSFGFRLYSSLWAFTLDFLVFRISFSVKFIWDFISTDSYGEHFPRTLLLITGANLLNTVDNMSLNIFHARLTSWQL